MFQIDTELEKGGKYKRSNSHDVKQKSYSEDSNGCLLPLDTGKNQGEETEAPVSDDFRSPNKLARSELQPLSKLGINDGLGFWG